MAIPLVTVKLYIPPPRPEWVPRPRLVERLNAGLDHKLTLVSAPAGFGKTTLLCEWAAAKSDTRIAWLSADRGDNDPIRFWAYVFAALQGVMDWCETALAALQSSRPPPIEHVLTDLINHLATLHQQVVLVLDDYHLIDNQAVHRALTFLLDHLPPQLRLMILTRADPPLPLARLRGRGELAELRVPDLRFTADEARAFFAQVMGLHLKAEALETLERRIEGWAVGLQLAALAMQGTAMSGRTDVDAFVAAFAGDYRYIIDYLTDEVFDQQPAEVQTFLLQTSILDRLSSSLCDAVTGGQDGQCRLEYLSRVNLFLVPLDEQRQWYRYHHLFADLLRYRLKQTFPDRVSGLHRRAIEWYVGHGFIDEAVHHALAASETRRAAEIIEASSSVLTGQGRMNSLKWWIESLPEALVLERPRICVSHAWTLNLTGQAEAVERRLQDAERALQAGSFDAQTAAEIRGNVAVLRSYAAYRRDDLAQAARLLQEALSLLPEEDRRLRSVASLRMGMLLKRQMSWDAAQRALEQARRLGDATGSLYVAMSACGQLAEMWIDRGRLHQAARLCRQVLERYQDQEDKPPVPKQGIYVRLACVLYEWNQLEAATDSLARGIALAERIMAVWPVIQDGQIRLAWIKQGEGKSEEARALLRRALEQADQMQDWTSKMRAQAWQARLDLAQGRQIRAIRWAEAYQARRSGLRARPDASEMTLIRILLAQNESGRALELLARLEQTAESMGAEYCLIQVLGLKALAYHAQRDTPQALATLWRALSLGEPEGYVRSFVDEGPRMETLLAALSAQATEPILHTYVRKLLNAFPPTSKAAQSSRPAHDPLALALVDPLKRRELEVLRLFSAGLTTPEIADQLTLAKSTIKWHLRNIYGKLGVHRRSEAIARAHELKLL